MATKPKTRGTKKKAAQRPKIQAKEQSERFIETARLLGVDESGKNFEREFLKTIKSKERR